MVASVPLITRRTCSHDGTRAHDGLGQQHLARGGRAVGRAVAGGGLRTASTTFGWAWPRMMAP